MAAAVKKWIQKALSPSSKGKLHEKLHVKEGEKIPEKKLEKAEHSKNPTLRKEAVLAETLKHMKHPKKAEEKKDHHHEMMKHLHKAHEKHGEMLKKMQEAHKHHAHALKKAAHKGR